MDEDKRTPSDHEQEVIMNNNPPADELPTNANTSIEVSLTNDTPKIDECAVQVEQTMEQQLPSNVPEQTTTTTVQCHSQEVQVHPLSQETSEQSIQVSMEVLEDVINKVVEQQENSSPIVTERDIAVVAEEILDVSKTEAVLTSSLALIANYGMSEDSASDSDSSSSSSSSSDSSDEDEVQCVDTVSYRNTVNVISSGEDGDSDVELVDVVEGTAKKRTKTVLKVKGEIDLVDLPPIEDLNISVPEHECIELGEIMSVVDQLVIVESKPGNVALDLDTVLFLDHGKRALGRIFDVLGQVNQPIYCVRFNSAEHVQEKEILAGMKVFYNNQRSEHTSVVVLPHLLRFKGSDASWDHDVEPPQGCLEYSDDEEERSVRKTRKTGQKAVPEDPTQQRMKRVRQPPPNRQARVRNPFSGPRYPHPPPPLPGNQWSNGGYNNSSNSNNNNNNSNNHSNPQWPQSQAGYGNNNSSTYSWHTFYQQQQHRYPPPTHPTTNPHGPVYVNPYAQQGPGTSIVNNAVQQGQHMMNYNGNYYSGGNSNGQGPSQGRQFKQEKH